MDVDNGDPSRTLDPESALDDFFSASPDELDLAYRGLVRTWWEPPTPDPRVAALTPRLVALMETLDNRRRGRLAILLGLLMEKEEEASPGGPVSGAVTAGVDQFIRLWRTTEPHRPLGYALMYLLSHFPQRRADILTVAREKGVDADDLSRLRRALTYLDPRNPVLGRVFPSPAVWETDDSVREFDRTWIESLSAPEVREAWAKDTRTVRGHLGAKAHWAVHQWATLVPVEDPPVAAPSRGAADHAALDWTPALAALRCPSCDGTLTISSDRAVCQRCGTGYTHHNGIIDVTAAAAAPSADQDFLLKLSEMPSMGAFYEARARPAFLRLSGGNWGGAVSVDDERAYLAHHVAPVAGPVLDLGAGAGTWTAMLAETVGADRVVALDPALPMLNALRHRLPSVPAVRANAGALPFADQSLGAVNCWNALQAFPGEASDAIREIGRCLRPHGTLTLMTFQQSPDPVYRYFVGNHYFPQHTTGLRLFDLPALRSWLAAAGLDIRHEMYPENFVFITATKAAH